jgi:hypothetical protein
LEREGIGERGSGGVDGRRLRRVEIEAKEVFATGI